jgi:hypothetical protein
MPQSDTGTLCLQGVDHAVLYLLKGGSSSWKPIQHPCVIVQHLTLFPLPLELGEPPVGYAWSDRALSSLSTTTAFNSGIDEQDKFLGYNHCIICGAKQQTWARILEHSHVIPKSEEVTVSQISCMSESPFSKVIITLWVGLKNHGWLPQLAKENP